MSSTFEFYKNLMVRLERELETQGQEEGNNKENILTKIYIDDLRSGNNPAIRDAQETSRYYNSSFNGKINGYYIDEGERSVIMYITYFEASNLPYLLKSTQFAAELAKLNNFVQQVISKPNEMLDIIQEDNPYYSLVLYLIKDFKSIDSFNYILLTNGNVGEIKTPTYKVKNKKVDISVFDIERYRRFMDGQKVVDIDADLSILGKPIPCSFVPSGKDYDTYCCILSGETIYRLFDTYHYQLLNSNVRTYLQLKGNVNKGIMETIETIPDYFLAYNNGISATASEVCLNADGDIEEIKNFQIVNGGQTSASIYNARANKGLNISKVNVMAKITVVKDENNYDNIVKNISRYANTQNAIKFSDFSSNDRYNKRMAEWSRITYTPAFGTKLQTKWYYENISGSYSNERSDSPSKTSFDKEYPKEQHFSKTDMASYELSYNGFPAEACKGAQDAYKVFVINFQNLNEPTETDFKRLVAKKILYDHVLNIITDECPGQGKTSIARYVVAYFSTVVCKNRFCIDKVWGNQNVPQEASEDLRRLVLSITNYLRDNAFKNQKSIEMYCRTPATWDIVKKLEFETENEDLYTDKEITINQNITTKQIPDFIVNGLFDSVQHSTWADMAQNAMSYDIDEKYAKTNATMCKTMISMQKEDITERQAAYALKILYRYYKSGYPLSGTEKVFILNNEDIIERITKKKVSSYSGKNRYFS